MHDIRIRYGDRSFSLVALYTVIVAVCYFLPAIKYSVPYIILGSALLITYVLAIFSGKIDRKVVFPSICCALGLMLVMSLFTKQGNLTEGINELIRALRLVAPGILFLMLCKSRVSNRREMTFIFLVIVGVVLFVCYNTLIELEENSMIARILAGGVSLDDEFKRLRFKNIGGFEMSYAAGFLAVFFLFLALECKKKLVSLLSAAAFIYLGYYVIRAQYMTLLLLVVVGCSFVLIMRTKGAGRVGMLAISVAAILAVPTLVEYLGAGTEESTGMLMDKFDQIEASQTSGLEALGSRPELYINSFLRFLESPLWGNPTIKNGYYVEQTVSSHSSLFGYLQSMGLLGTVMFYLPLARLMRACCEEVQGLSKNAKSFWILICVLLLILSVLNPIDYCFEITFMVFLCIPCGMLVFLKKSD